MFIDVQNLAECKNCRWLFINHRGSLFCPICKRKSNIPVCTICGEPEYFHHMGIRRPFKPDRDARSFMCCRCVTKGERFSVQEKKYKRKRRTKARRLSPQAKALKSLRKSKGLSQSAFADELGVTQTMVSKIELGEKTVPQKIAAILNI